MRSRADPDPNCNGPNIRVYLHLVSCTCFFKRGALNMKV